MKNFLKILLVTLILSWTNPAMAACSQYAAISVGSLAFNNNIWNRNTDSSATQCISKPSAKSNVVVWSWLWHFTGWTPHSYPEGVFGWKPWNTGTTNAALPLSVSLMKTATVTYNIQTTITSTAIYNTSFDIWLTTSAKPTPKSINTEVMIWINGTGASPAGIKTGTYTIGSRTYELWEATFTGWKYIAFRDTSNSSIGSYDLKPFLTFLVDNKKIASSGLYVASIELGNEIWSGAGNTSFNSMTVAITK